MSQPAFLSPSPFAVHRGRQQVRSSPRRPTVCAARPRDGDNGKRELELNWRFQDKNNRLPVTCRSCKGTGMVECQWCNSTGVLMLGDTLICSVDGGCTCLICDDGDVKCRKCKGVGRIAGWLQ